MTLKDKVIVITGASSGMGAATTKLAVDEGAKLVIGARNADKLAALKNSTSHPENVITQVTDVYELDQVEALVKTAVDEFGQLDIIYNNAGIMPQDTIANSDPKSWQQMVDTNIIGVLNGIKASLPYMHKQGHGLIMATDSVAGHVLYPGSATYNGTKFAVRAIMEGLRQEEHANGIKSGIISPGAVNTNLFDSVGNQEIEANLRKMAEDNSMVLSAEDVAHAAIYMMSQPATVDVNEIIVRPIGQSI
ncbi:SDR family oxidoreductase [Nicoliella lavandulae]|uniref:SDR family oxidoreductase n=1 Tax=Nicoliella lavandulae TaxID=3082954 RepID=A0ABU8SJ43_9LACO